MFRIYSPRGSARALFFLLTGWLLTASPGEGSPCATDLNLLTTEDELRIYARIVAGDLDAPLIYADLIQERGDRINIARAEAIRFRVALDRRSPWQRIAFWRKQSHQVSEWPNYRRRAEWYDYSLTLEGDRHVHVALDFKGGIPFSSSISTHFTPGAPQWLGALAVWERAPTLFDTDFYDLFHAEPTAEFSAWPLRAVVAASARGVIGALHRTDQHPSIYTSEFNAYLAELLTLAAEDKMNWIGPLIWKRLDAASPAPESVRRYRIIKALLQNDRSAEAAAFLVQFPFYPFYPTNTPRLEGGQLLPFDPHLYAAHAEFGRRNNHTLGHDNALPHTQVARIGRRLWQRLIDLQVGEVPEWKAYLKQDRRVQRATTRQLLFELARLADSPTDQADARPELIRSLSVLKTYFDPPTSMAPWDF